MTRTDGSPARAAPRSTRFLVGLGLLATLLAFLAGRWAAEGPDPAPGAPAAAAATTTRPAAPPSSEPGRGWAARPPEVEAPGGAPARAAVAAVAPGRATPEVVAQATAETTAALEEARPDLASRCWPRGGLASGASSTTVTFNVTFDASGREIARGLGEDRRSRAPELLRCIQKLPLGTLRIRPPGASVGVRVAMRLP